MHTVYLNVTLAVFSSGDEIKMTKCFTVDPTFLTIKMSTLGTGKLTSNMYDLTVHFIYMHITLNAYHDANPSFFSIAYI